jgi:AhpD family alkylhydroperoxidase
LSAPRIAPGSRRDVGLFTWSLARAAGRVSGTRPPNIFTTLGRHRRLFRGWLRFASRLMPRGTLPRRETELVILRVAHLRESAYELAQHERIARRAGVSREELEHIQHGVDGGDWSARERVILSAVDELHESGDLSDPTWSELRAHLDEKETIELLMLAGHYEMLAVVLNTLRVQPDQPRRPEPAHEPTRA